MRNLITRLFFRYAWVNFTVPCPTTTDGWILVSRDQAYRAHLAGRRVMIFR